MLPAIAIFEKAGAQFSSRELKSNYFSPPSCTLCKLKNCLRTRGSRLNVQLHLRRSPKNFPSRTDSSCSSFSKRPAVQSSLSSFYTSSSFSRSLSFKHLMALPRKRHLSPHDEMPLLSLHDILSPGFTSFLTQLLPRTKTLSLQPWTRLHTHESSPRCSLPPSPTSRTPRCVSSLPFCFIDPTPYQNAISPLAFLLFHMASPTSTTNELLRQLVVQQNPDHESRIFCLQKEKVDVTGALY